MNPAEFVYVVYIATTPEAVWKALTEGDVTRKYWGHENISDWRVGSRWDHRPADGTGKVLLTGKVLEIVPPRRLVLTWAEPADAADATKHSRVTFEIEPVADMVRLTVTHDELEAGSKMQRSIAEGWPRVLSSLKSFLETGRALDTWAKAGK
jgi:uncharacterized protein YndB with AHSA1/START domain